MNMINYRTFILFIGVATAQTSLKLSSCLTKDQNLQMFCSFTPASDPKLPKNCYYMTENKLVGSTNVSMIPDSTFQNRAEVTIANDNCQLLLKGISSDKPKNYTCFIKQTTIPVSVIQAVDKSKLQTCSAWCVMQHGGVALLIAFLTFPLMSELV
ncbi:hypothetical protein DNTS_012853 [Danionella cerebrum]|uniref:Immunoglobulin V-set domain-containing protein n=1 Tax=Danionella cerebrum TaxID=2873325 RepID=A0A553QT66_9TELE|nr:hypothetical protein DNTS_012853 [Danionella translucida]